jgi:hypothetical protein
MLAEGGVFGLSVTSSENYIGDDLAEFLGCVKTTLGEVFPVVAALPGDPCHFVAGRAGVMLTRDPAALAARIADRKLDVVFVREYYLDDRLSEERKAYLDGSLARTRAPVNTDLRPVCQYLSLVLWSRQFTTSSLLRGLPELLTVRNAVIVAAAVVVLLGLPALRRRRAGAAFRRSVASAIFVVGATEISLEITALLAFQSLYGYVYQRLALIVASFMAGLAFGGWLGSRAIRRGAGARSFVLIQLGICAVPLGLTCAIKGVAGLPAAEMAPSAALFPLVVVGSAVLAGMQFPVAARLYDQGKAGATGGRLYGADLLGSATGATAAAVFLVPVMGVVRGLGALSILNVAVLLSLLMSLRGAPKPEV